MRRPLMFVATLSAVFIIACASTVKLRRQLAPSQIEISSETIYQGGIRVDQTSIVFAPEKTTAHQFHQSGRGKMVVRQTTDITAEPCRYSQVRPLVARIRFTDPSRQEAREQKDRVRREIVSGLMILVDGRQVVPGAEAVAVPAYAKLMDLFRRCTPAPDPRVPPR